MTDVPISKTIPSTGFALNSRWRTAGGGTLLVAAALLLVATLLEAGTLGDPSARTPLFWLFVAVFAVCSVLFLVATILLAFGRRRDDGIVGDSVLGKVSLLAFGALWLVSQAAYLIGTYFAASDALLATSTVLSLVMIVGAAIGGIVIAVRGIATGPARWSLLLAVVISVVTSTIAGGTSAVGLITAMHVISSLGLMYVGLTYLRARRIPARW